MQIRRQFLVQFFTQFQYWLNRIDLGVRLNFAVWSSVQLWSIETNVNICGQWIHNKGRSGIDEAIISRCFLVILPIFCQLGPISVKMVTSVVVDDISRHERNFFPFSLAPLYRVNWMSAESEIQKEVVRSMSPSPALIALTNWKTALLLRLQNCWPTLALTS